MYGGRQVFVKIGGWKCRRYRAKRGTMYIPRDFIRFFPNLKNLCRVGLPLVREVLKMQIWRVPSAGVQIL